jgi:hypothetical protein
LALTSPTGGARNHENENVRYIGQGEATQTKKKNKIKNFKLGDGHLYDCSSVYTALEA